MLLSQLNILATISSIDSKLLRLSGEVFLYNASAIAGRYILIFCCSSESIYTWVMVIYLLSIMPSTWQGNYFSIYTHCPTGMLPLACCFALDSFLFFARVDSALIFDFVCLVLFASYAFALPPFFFVYFPVCAESLPLLAMFLFCVSATTFFF